MEKLVQLIEQSISPDSVVEHSKRLPILTSTTGATAQCDIVIYTGKPPRQTLTIVEVQDRKRAVNINEFRGWVTKLTDVGAQHLYCVSRNPFPQSIKEQAARHGNMVKLITLKQIDSNQIPLSFFETSFIATGHDIRSMRKLETVFPALNTPEKLAALQKVHADLSVLKSNDPKFSTDRSAFLALATFCIHHNTPAKESHGEIKRIDLGYDDNRPLYFYSDGQFFQIRLKLEYIWHCKNIKVPISMLSYDQDNDGVLAWVLEAYYDSPQGPVWFKIPVAKSGNNFTISNMIVSLPENSEFSFYINKQDQAKP